MGGGNFCILIFILIDTDYIFMSDGLNHEGLFLGALLVILFY